MAALAGPEALSPLGALLEPAALGVALPSAALVAVVGALWALGERLRPHLPPLSGVVPVCLSWGWSPGPPPAAPSPTFRTPPVRSGGLGGVGLGPLLARPPFEALTGHAPLLALPGVRASNAYGALARLYRSPFAGLPAGPSALSGGAPGALPTRPWPQEAALDGRPLMAGSPRPWGGDWGGLGGRAYEVGRRVAHVKWDHLRYGLGQWHAFRWRVPTPVTNYHLGFMDPIGAPLDIPLPHFVQRWFIPLANFDRHPLQLLWVTSYTHPFREPFTRAGRWGTDHLKTPHGMGPTDRWHTAVFPDREWARGQDPVFRQVGNRALAMWQGDSLPSIPTWEDPAEMGGELLHDELSFDALGRFSPARTESYVKCLAVSHLLWWDHWRIFFNVRGGLRRLARLDGSVATLPRGAALGWGGYRPHRHWDAAPGVAGPRRAQIGGHIDVWGPRPLGPSQGRGGTLDHLGEPDLALDRGIPHRIGSLRAYGGRRGGNRLNQAERAFHGRGLDPASLPWGAQAWLRGLDRRSAGDPLGPEVTWLGGWWARLLGREAWSSAQGWGGALGLGPHLRRFPLGSWAPGL